MTDRAEQQGMTTKTRIKIVVGIILGILGLIIMFQNTETVTTRLLFLELPMPRFVLLLVMLLIGFILGVVTMTIRKRRRAKER